MDFHAYVRARLPPLQLTREPEILDELAQHLSDLYSEALVAGLPHDEALARAAAALPDSARDLGRAIESASRSLPARIVDRWQAPLDDPVETPGRYAMLSDLRADLRYAARMLLRSPGFAVVVILTMALGVGANAAVFSAVDAVLLRRAPVVDPERVVSVYTSNSDGRAAYGSSSYPDYLSLRDSGAFGGLAAFTSIGLSIDFGGETDLVPAELVSGNYFDVLGVRVAHGRPFRPDEDRPGAPERVIVISHRLWRERFGADPAVVGRSLRVNAAPYTIVGVAPRAFRSPILGRSPDAWVPMGLQQDVRPPSAGVRRSLGGSDLLGVRGVRWLNMIGRLPDGATIEATAAQVDGVARAVAAPAPDSNGRRAFTVDWLGRGPGVRTSAMPVFRLLGVSVALVLVIASTNISGLLLSRAATRRREIAVRIAIGAGRARLVRQLLTEAVFLALLGAIGGLVIAALTAPLLYGFGIPADVPLGVNGRVLAFALAVAGACGLAFGVAPVVQTLRVGALAALRDEGGPIASGVSATRLRRVFVVAQVALSLMLVVGAGLFLRTLQQAYAVDLGYSVDRLLLADINLDVRGYSPERGQAFFERALERLRAIPGVIAVGAARVPVLGGSVRSGLISTDGRPVQPDGSNAMLVRANVIDEAYLEAMGIPLLRGRSFAAGDTAGSPPVAIVSRGLADRLWPGADPVGRTFVAASTRREVVGVVPDSVYASAIEENPPPFYYSPLKQAYESGMTLHLRTAGDPLALLPAVRAAVRDLDPDLVVARPRTLRADFESSLGEQRTMALLVGLFGAVALGLAGVGLYGTMAQLAAQRTVEMGIRLALGARPRAVLLMLAGEGLRLVAAGTLLGFAGALASARLVRSQLFGVAPTDAVAFGIGIAVLSLVGVVACLVPACRAMRLDPVRVLRG